MRCFARLLGSLWLSSQEKSSFGLTNPLRSRKIPVGGFRSSHRTPGSQYSNLRKDWYTRMERLKVCVIGGGSTYTPELVEGFVNRSDELPVGEIALTDIDPERLEVVGGLAARMVEKAGLDARVELTTERRRAIEGSDFVITQIRVGGVRARIQDERIPLKFGAIGQETTGPGGFAKALRTIPVIMDIARDVEELAPNGWLINFTNPSGIITEVLLNHSRVRAIGLCNAPIGIVRGIASRLGASESEVFVRYVGLNHLSWVTAVYYRGQDVTRESAEKAIEGRSQEEAAWMRKFHMIPNSYLRYYYGKARILAEQKKAQKTRGEVVADVEAELLKLYRDADTNEKPKLLEKRGGANYSTAAVSLASAIYNHKNELHIVNVRNRSTIPWLPYDSAIEANCLVNSAGAHPLTIGEVPDGIRDLMQTVKTYEQLTVKAGTEGSYADALEALSIHPLVPSREAAKRLLDKLLVTNREYLPQF